MSAPVPLTVNGVARQVAVTPRATLLSVLRDGLGLTGTKTGCNQGVCGACTVLVDGLPVRSCLTLAVSARDAEVTTVEGLGEASTLTDIQQTFADAGAIQCGFCASGILVTVHWLLRQNPTPSVDEVRAALSGNLCRCSGYKQIVDAVLDASGGKAG